MANSHNDFKPRRSRRSGVKKMKLIKTNLAILKKYLAVLFILIFVSSCTTIKYVIVDPKDTTKLVEVRKRIIHDDYIVPPSSLYYYNNWWFNRPYYYSPRIIYTPRPSFGPLPPTPRPHR